MSKYEKRLVAPSKDNKCFYSDNVFYRSGYGMPNCTCYAWGRWYELLGAKPKLYTGNAKTWYGKTGDGYQRGQEPKLGAVACWSSSGAGHVAIVEEILSDGSIVTSNSAWKGTNFYTKKIQKPYSFGNYKFQGFIYLPIEFDEEKPIEIGEYTVKRGECLSVIGAKLGIDWKKIAELNNIVAPYTVYAGQQLKLTGTVEKKEVGRNTVKQIKKLKANVRIWSNPNLNGTYFSYLKNTEVKILENVSVEVDKIEVPATGRIAYINIAWYK